MMEGGGDMLILLTGVGGALSALGRDIPAKSGTDGQRVHSSGCGRALSTLPHLRPVNVSDFADSEETDEREVTSDSVC